MVVVGVVAVVVLGPEWRYCTPSPDNLLGSGHISLFFENHAEIEGGFASGEELRAGRRVWVWRPGWGCQQRACSVDTSHTHQTSGDSHTERAQVRCHLMHSLTPPLSRSLFSLSLFSFFFLFFFFWYLDFSSLLPSLPPSHPSRDT